MQNASHIR